MISAGIGEMVSDYQINSVNDFIKTYGIDAFRNAVFNGSFSEVSYAYIHPCDDLRKTENFDIIQEVFFNAYV